MLNQNKARLPLNNNKIIDVKCDDLIKFKISGFKENNNFLVYPYIFDYDKNISLSNCIKSIDVKSSETDIELQIPYNVDKIVLYILFNNQKINSVFQIENINFQLISRMEFNCNLLYAPFSEADGADLLLKEKEIFLLNKYNFYNYELIGYDANNKDDLSMNMSFVLLQRTVSSGIVINCGNMNWCSKMFLME